MSVELRDDGTARIGCATQDIGTGTYTILAQIAAERLGLAVANVEVARGDTRLPAGPQSGGLEHLLAAPDGSDLQTGGSHAT